MKIVLTLGLREAIVPRSDTADPPNAAPLSGVRKLGGLAALALAELSFLLALGVSGGQFPLSFDLALPALAHGVGYREAGGLPPVALEFFYSTGEPMSYREAKVFSPADEKFANQTGRTDAAGRFAFVPDVPGLWRVVVRDEEGHQATAELEVTEPMLKGGGSVKSEESPAPAAASSNPPEGLELLIRAALGVSLLFNLAAFTLLRRHSHAH